MRASWRVDCPRGRARKNESVEIAYPVAFAEVHAQRLAVDKDRVALESCRPQRMQAFGKIIQAGFIVGDARECGTKMQFEF